MWLLLAVTLFAVTACGSDDSSDNGDTTADTTDASDLSVRPSGDLRVVVPEGWGWIRDAARVFMRENPGVKIKVEGANNQGYIDNLPRTLATGDAPDVTWLQVAPGSYETLIDQGLLENLNDVWEADDIADVLRPATVESFTAADGNHYAINQGLYWTSIWINEDAFARAGIEPPSRGRIESEAKLYEYAAALRRAGYIPLLADIDGRDYATNGVTWLLNPLIQSSCGDDGFDALSSSWDPRAGEPEVTWTSDCVVRALETVRRWADDGLFGDNPSELSGAKTYALFSTGKGGMYMSGSWMPQGFHIAREAGDPTFRYSWAVAPPVDGGEATGFFHDDYDALGVPTNSDNVATAKQFLELLASRRFVSTLRRFINGPPGVDWRTDVPEPPEVDATITEQIEAFDELGDLGDIAYNTPYGPAMVEPLATMMSGKTSPEEAAEALQELSDRARAEREG